VDTGLTTFDLNVTSVINDIKVEGTKIKAMVVRHIEKMIATLGEKARHEKESLTKMLVDYKQQLEKAKGIEKREDKIQKTEILQLSQTKRKSSLCSLHLNFTSGTTFSAL
jgi:lipoate-protein ligase A